MIRWLREQAKLTHSQCAELVGVDEDTLVSWESEGGSHPTVGQARKLAETLGSHFTVLFRPKPLDDLNPPLRDNRRGIMTEPRSELIVSLECRRIWAKQLWLKEAFGSSDRSWNGRTGQGEGEREIADRIRRALDLEDRDAVRGDDLYASLNNWIARVENAGVLVFSTRWVSRRAVEPTYFRGAALFDANFPAVIYNSKDAIVARIFTLAHELAHIFLRNPVLNNYSTDEPSEILANAIAAEVVLPMSYVESRIVPSISRNVTNVEDLFASLRDWSSRLHVSREVIARRLLDFGTISQSSYRRIRDLLSAEYAERGASAQKVEGGDYYRSAVKWAGRKFARLVLDEYRAGAIPAAEASTLLGVKVNNFSKFEEVLARGAA